MIKFISRMYLKIWTILSISLLFFVLLAFFFVFDKENNKKRIFNYLRNGDKSYWKESYCLMDDKSQKDFYKYHSSIEDDYLYFDKDTLINFEKTIFFKDLTFSLIHYNELEDIKTIDFNNFYKNSYAKRKRKQRYIFQIINKNKFRILYEKDNSILHEFERINEMPKIDTIESLKLKEIYTKSEELDKWSL